MLVILKCKECNTTFQVRIDNFFDHNIKCTKCYSTLEPFHKQRLFDIADNLIGLNNFMNRFSAIGITEAHSKSYMLENLSSLDSSYLASDKESKLLLEKIVDVVYLLTRSALESNDLQELNSIYEYLQKLHSDKCGLKNAAIIQSLLNSVDGE